LRFPFRELPDPSGPAVRARPIVDVIVDGLELAPQACLLDTGATAVRMGRHVAELVGIDLSETVPARIAVGGARLEARLAEVVLEIGAADDRFQWEAPVWFCDPWHPAFGLLGFTGFFDHFEVTIAAYDEWIELRPVR
jgi:hypothetical protein